jgi:hypothetical protein
VPATTSNVNVNTETGLVIGGHLNDDPAQLLTFTGTETLVGDGSGQASVGALDNLLDTAVTFALTGATFNLATFNLSPLSGNNPNEATSVQVSYIPTFGGSPIAFTLDGNGKQLLRHLRRRRRAAPGITFGNSCRRAAVSRASTSARWWRSAGRHHKPAGFRAGASHVGLAASRVRCRWCFAPHAETEYGIATADRIRPST